MFQLYIQATRGLNRQRDASPRLQWNTEWDPYWSPFIKVMREIHAELAYFIILFNTTPLKLVWCFNRVPRAASMGQNGLRDTVLFGAEGPSSSLFQQRMQDLSDINDTVEAMACVQHALYKFEAPHGTRLGPPKMPERLLAPLRAELLDVGLTADEDYYQQSFQQQPSSISVCELSKEKSLAGDDDVPSLIQLSFCYLTHAQTGLAWDAQNPDPTVTRWHETDPKAGSLLLRVPMTQLLCQRGPLNSAVVQYHDQVAPVDFAFDLTDTYTRCNESDLKLERPVYADIFRKRNPKCWEVSQVRCQGEPRPWYEVLEPLAPDLDDEGARRLSSTFVAKMAAGTVLSCESQAAVLCLMQRTNTDPCLTMQHGLSDHIFNFSLMSVDDSPEPVRGVPLPTFANPDLASGSMSTPTVFREPDLASGPAASSPAFHDADGVSSVPSCQPTVEPSSSSAGQTPGLVAALLSNAQVTSMPASGGSPVSLADAVSPACEVTSEPQQPTLAGGVQTPGSPPAEDNDSVSGYSTQTVTSAAASEAEHEVLTEAATLLSSEHAKAAWRGEVSADSMTRSQADVLLEKFETLLKKREAREDRRARSRSASRARSVSRGPSARRSRSAGPSGASVEPQPAAPEGSGPSQPAASDIVPEEESPDPSVLEERLGEHDMVAQTLNQRCTTHLVVLEQRSYALGLDIDNLSWMVEELRAQREDHVTDGDTDLIRQATSRLDTCVDQLAIPRIDRDVLETRMSYLRKLAAEAFEEKNLIHSLVQQLRDKYSRTMYSQFLQLVQGMQHRFSELGNYIGGEATGAHFRTHY